MSTSCIACFTIIFFTALNALAHRPNSDDTSIYNECLWNQEALDIKVDCNDVYNHYHPKKYRYRPTKDVRLGSYNILRISWEKGKKNLPLTARMINAEWDVLALSELQPGRTEDINQSFNYGRPYTLPEYIVLLQELQKLDSSWGLIISPYSQGIDAELFGFLYRAKRARPVESKYCYDNYLDDTPYDDGFVYRQIGESGIETSQNGSPLDDRSFELPEEAIACPLRVEGLRSDLFTKVPLTARFESGDFEFSYISLHLSFRGFAERYDKCLVKCQLSALEALSLFNGREDNLVAETLRKFSEEFEEEISFLERDLPLQECENSLSSSKKKACIDKLEDKYNEENGPLQNSLMAEALTRIKNSLSTREIERHFSRNLLDVFRQITGDEMISKTEGRMLNRYFQTFTVMEAFSEMVDEESTNDVIVGGDFNLEVEDNEKHWRHLLWVEALSVVPGADLYIEDLTSINRRRQHGKNYDHFILSGLLATDECDADGAEPLDYVDQSLVLSDGFELGEEVDGEDYAYVLSDHLPISMSCSTRDRQLFTESTIL